MARPDDQEDDTQGQCEGGTKSLPRSPDSAAIIEKIISRHRGAFARLAKLDSSEPEGDADAQRDNRAVARKPVERHLDALKRLAKR